MRAEQPLWIVVLFCISLGICALLGFFHDLRNRMKREVLLTSDRQRARVMADFYIHAGGAER